jgi:hypothetical protein
MTLILFPQAAHLNVSDGSPAEDSAPPETCRWHRLWHSAAKRTNPLAAGGGQQLKACPQALSPQTRRSGHCVPPEVAILAGVVRPTMDVTDRPSWQRLESGLISPVLRRGSLLAALINSNFATTSSIITANTTVTYL